MDPLFLTSLGDFLNCDIRILPPCKYLILSVGASPKLESTWDPLVNLLTKKLHSWRHTYFSLGG